jgi:hypothetical protein
MTNFDYYAFQHNFVIDSINDEINFYQEHEYSGANPINEYLTYLKGRIGADIPETATVTRYSKVGEKYEIKKMNMNEYAKDLDILVFKRPWKKMKEFHKIMKIKEYVDELKFGEKASTKAINKNKEYLKNEIIDGLKNKKFLKGKSTVEYKEKRMKIKSISSVYYNKKTGLYEIDWDE